MRRPPPIAGVVALVLILSSFAAWSETPGDVTIYRDTWGVPHIYGETQEAAAYGHGYAQAQDRLEDIFTAYLIGLGRAAGAFGAERLETDYVARVARHARVARDRYGELSPETRQLFEYFVAGIRAYMRAHPDAVPEWAVAPEPHHVVALYRGFAWAWPWGQARGDLKRAGSHVSDGRGSNAWVVGASRSAAGAPIALIDPHLSWEPQNRFYEAHVHGGDLHFYGFSIIGTPVMAVGHTDVFSLALTTGGPDCADVYEEKIHPDDPLKYEYDGTWRSIEVEEIEIAVKTSDGVQLEKRRVERTHHGPILRRRGDRAFAVRTGYDDEIGIGDQWLKMVKARDLGDFLKALRENQSLPQNIMYADVYGNLYYVRAGRVPVRPAGYRWDRPVPGWTSETEWRGIHPLADLVQILNPPGGFMQNCNVAPATMMPGSPLTAERYPDVLYNIRPDRLNSRGRRALDLLSARGKLTLDDALRIAVDTYVQGADRWQQALAAAFDAHRKRFASLEPAVRLLLDWDRYMETDRAGAALFRFWMRSCQAKGSNVPSSRIGNGEALNDTEQVALLEALERTVRKTTEALGRIDAPWGELHRIKRGERSWPVGGCRADGISTLRSVRLSSPDASGVSYAYGGQICTTVVLLEEGRVVSYSATPYGQSNDPSSAHYADQSERLFSAGKLRPTWYAKDDLLRNLESKLTLAVPAIPSVAVRADSPGD